MVATTHCPQSPERKNISSGILHKYIHVYIHILIFCMPQDESEKICVTVVFAIALLLNFIDISFLPRAEKQRV